MINKMASVEQFSDYIANEMYYRLSRQTGFEKTASDNQDKENVVGEVVSKLVAVASQLESEQSPLVKDVDDVLNFIDDNLL